MIGLTTSATSDRDYQDLLARVQDRLTTMIADGSPLFTTDSGDLYDLLMAGLPASEQQAHRCHACRTFVNKFGGLVVIDVEGNARSALWSLDHTPEMYRASISAMLRAIQHAQVTGVFYTSTAVLGLPVTGQWQHFAATLPRSFVFQRMTQTAGQAMAEKREDYGTLCRALADFDTTILQTAVGLLKAESLYRSEKVLGVAEWLLTLHQSRSKQHGTRRDNLTWRAVATAPVGYCHPRSSMIGTLLEDIAAGLSYETIKQRFAAKMHPLQYQRPQADPTAGNIRQAEQVIAQLQAAGALARRFARLEDIQTIWRSGPLKTEQHRSGVFGHLQLKIPAKRQPSLIVPPTVMTWEKFQRVVLPEAQTIEFYVPQVRESYTALVTAADPDAPLIFQWDHPVSWYVYYNGSTAAEWGLTADHFHPVTAVTLQPSMWDNPDRLTYQGAGVIFILDGARDTQDAGLALFPETLRSEFHPIRATIEAFSKRGTIADREQASACGVLLQKGVPWTARFRVTTASGISSQYLLDRWD